jgi:hypothetical protein
MKQDERDMLIRVDQRMTDFTKVAEKFMTKAESEEGFARCQVHKADMANLDKSIGRVRKGIWGIASSMFLATMGLFYNMFK